MNRFKTTRYLLLAGLLLILVAVAKPATARAEVIIIANHRTDTVKVCVYRSSDWTWVNPINCWTLKKLETAKWNRGKDQSYFDVRVFQPGILDRLLCEGRELSNAASLIIAAPCSIKTYNPPKSKPVKPPPASPPAPKPAPAPTPKPVPEAMLTVCNRSDWGTINFAIAFVVDVDIVDRYVVAEGWWKVRENECKNILLNDRMKKWSNPARQAEKITINPRVFIYGESDGIIKKVWEGNGYDPEYCINNSRNFEIKQGTDKKRECVGSEHDRVQMIGVPRRGNDKHKFLWNFG